MRPSLLPTVRIALPAIGFLAISALPVRSAPVVTVGDSLTKEYQVTFPGVPSVGVDGIDADHPAARNWIEILYASRSAHFEAGRFRNTLLFDMYRDLRLLGHEYNWAVPGATARQIRNLLTGEDLGEITGDDEIGTLLAFAPEWEQSVPRIAAQLQSEAGGVVLFCGGNDLRFGNSDPSAASGSTPIAYATIYTGNGTGSGDPQPLMDSIRNSIRESATVLRAANPSLPLAICAVPHVGAAPDVNAQWPFDPVRTGRITAALDALNADLETWTASLGNAVWVDTPYALTRDLLGKATLPLGGQTFQVAADPLGPDDSAADHNLYLFAQDGFHPTTVLQGLMAEGIHSALREAFPAAFGDSPAFGLDDVLAAAGLPPAPADPLADFLAAAGVPEGERGPLDDPDGDGIPNLLEFALDGFRPAAHDAPLLPSPGRDGTSLILTWSPRAAAAGTVALRCESSADLQAWAAVPESAIDAGDDGSLTAHLQVVPGESAWLRIRAELIP